VSIIEKYRMIPSMSRPANPFDNARCESFMKTLKREEIYANRYRDLEDLRANVLEFIERYYNQRRLHSALGYQCPVEFEQRRADHAEDLQSATIVFLENNVNEERDSSELMGRGLNRRPLPQTPSPARTCGNACLQERKLRPKNCDNLGVHPKVQPRIGEQCGNKTGVAMLILELRLPQRQPNHRNFGGSVWESNPPPWPRRTGSMALKATRITGPLSPPMSLIT
jgi:hypothetical protein